MPTERHVEQAARERGRARTFRSWLEGLAAEGAPGSEACSPETTRLLAARILERPIKVGAVVDNALGALRKSGASPEFLRRVEHPRAALLADLWEQADAWLAQRKLRDERRNAWLVSAGLERSAIAPEHCSRLTVRGLVFDAGILACLEAAHTRLRAQHSEGVVLEMPSPEAPGSAGLEGLFQSLEARWGEHRDPPAIEYVKGHENTSLHVIQAEHDASEARAAAHLVVAALAAGTPLDRIAIAAVDLEEAFLDPLRAELTGAGIPYSEPRGRPIIASPEAHAALELLWLSRGALSRDALIDLLQSPVLRAQRWFGEQPEKKRALLLTTLKSLSVRFDRKDGELDHALRRYFQQRSRESPERNWAEAAAESARALSAIRADLGALCGTRPRAEFVASWLALCSELGFSQPSRRALTSALRAWERGAPELLHALGAGQTGIRRAEGAAERVIAGARALGLEDEPVTLDAFIEELELALEGVGPESGAERAGALRIARPEELSGLDLDVAIVCRASSSRLDWARSDAGALLDEDFLERLPARMRPQTRADQQRATLLSLTWIVTRSKQVHVTFARRDAQGKTGASRWVLELLGRGASFDVEPASALFPQARRAVAFPKTSADARRRQQLESARSEFFLDTAREPGAYTGHAHDLSARLRGDHATPIAITALERYARCPFAAFAEYVLRASKAQEASEDFGARERGISIHAALEAAFEAIRGKWGSSPRAELEELALARARDYLAALAHSSLHRAGIDTLFEDVAAFIRYSLAQADGLFFERAEQAFGGDSAGHWPPLALGPFAVSGRIDRIDVNTDRSRARIVDYKTGKRPSGRDQHELLLQPQLYAIKVGLELDIVHVSAGYLALEQRRVRWTTVHDPESSGEQTTDALSRALGYIADFRAGYVPPRPRDGRMCNHCEARSICRRPLFASELEDGD